MKKKLLFSSATLGALAMAATPNTAAAGTCEMEFAQAYGSCNGDEICEMFAHWDYQDCIANEDPPGTSQPGPGGG